LQGRDLRDHISVSVTRSRETLYHVQIQILMMPESWPSRSTMRGDLRLTVLKEEGESTLNVPIVVTPRRSPAVITRRELKELLELRERSLTRYRGSYEATFSDRASGRKLENARRLVEVQQDHDRLRMTDIEPRIREVGSQATMTKRTLLYDGSATCEINENDVSLKKGKRHYWKYEWPQNLGWYVFGTPASEIVAREDVRITLVDGGLQDGLLEIVYDVNKGYSRRIYFDPQRSYTITKVIGFSPKNRDLGDFERYEILEFESPCKGFFLGSRAELEVRVTSRSGNPFVPYEFRIGSVKHAANMLDSVLDKKAFEYEPRPGEKIVDLLGESPVYRYVTDTGKVARFTPVDPRSNWFWNVLVGGNLFHGILSLKPSSPIGNPPKPCNQITNGQQTH